MHDIIKIITIIAIIAGTTALSLACSPHIIEHYSPVQPAEAFNMYLDNCVGNKEKKYVKQRILENELTWNEAERWSNPYLIKMRDDIEKRLELRFKPERVLDPHEMKMEDGIYIYVREEDLQERYYYKQGPVLYNIELYIAPSQDIHYRFA